MDTIGIGFGMLMAFFLGVAHAQDDPRLHPGELRVVDVTRAGLKEIVPGAVYMRHWFGTHQSTALFEFPASAGSDTGLALHSHGSEMAVQMVGDSSIVDERGRHYPVRQGDVILVKANVRHTGTFGANANRILSVVTPPRPEYADEDGNAYFPGHGQPAVAAASARPADAGSAVRTLFNLQNVEASLLPVGSDSLAFRHWHGQDVSVAVTRLRVGQTGHLRAAHAVHGEEVTFLLRGTMTLTQGDGAVLTAHAGQLVMLPPYRAHSAACLTDDCLLLSWHTPRRDEWGAEGSLPDVRFASTGGGAVTGAAYAGCPCQQGQPGKQQQ
ncbi:hypothetical protein [Immundisolibacter sp.]|uniref:hypothetical protein n=1 Tax=Immundisolibacter sp. TaxID=1934948 RepID=UPI0035697C48